MRIGSFGVLRTFRVIVWISSIFFKKYQNLGKLTIDIQCQHKLNIDNIGNFAGLQRIGIQFMCRNMKQYL